MWVVAGKFFSFFIHLAVTALMARLLPPDEMGIFFLISSLVNFYMMFSLLGMERSIVRTVAESLALDQPERASAAVRYVLQFGLLSSSVVAFLTMSEAGQMISERIFNMALTREFLIYSAAWVILLTLETLVVESFRGFHDIRFATIYNGLITYIFSSLALGFILLRSEKADITLVLQVIIIAHAINFMIAFFSLLKTTPIFRLRNTGVISRSHVLRTSWALYFTNISLFFMSSGQLWLLAYASTKESVAIYGAVSRFMILLTTTLTMVKFVILPMIGHLYTKKDYHKLERVLRSSATIAGLPAIAGLFLIIVFGKTILYYVYGPYYTAGYTALLILAVANLINVFTGVPGALMVMAGKENILLVFSVFSSLIGFALGFLLVGPMDCAGVAIGGGTGIILYNLIMFWYCKTRLSINTLMSFQEFFSTVSTLRYNYFNYSPAGAIGKQFRKKILRIKS